MPAAPALHHQGITLVMPHDDTLETADALDRLDRSGWSVGDVGFATEGGMVWLVKGGVTPSPRAR